MHIISSNFIKPEFGEINLVYLTLPPRFSCTILLAQQGHDIGIHIVGKKK